MKIVFAQVSLKELKALGIVATEGAKIAMTLSNWRLDDIFKPREKK